jgi:hypothetical protein
MIFKSLAEGVFNFGLSRSYQLGKTENGCYRFTIIFCRFILFTSSSQHQWILSDKQQHSNVKIP